MKTLKLRRNPSSSDLSEAVKDYRVPSAKDADGVHVPVNLVALVDPTVEPVPLVKNRPWGNGTITRTRDATTNDSDKSFTVPAGKVWEMIYLGADMLCTATVGNRALAVQVNDGTNAVWNGRTPASAAAGQGVNHTVYFSSAALPDDTTAVGRVSAIGVNVGMKEGCPLRFLPAGYSIRVWDSNAIDPAADDLTVVLVYVEHDA